jgi:hypothetical protein
MTSMPSSDIFWASAAGAVTFVGILMAPFLHRWRLARHARRLEARQHRGYDRYYEELRELETWVPQGRTALDVRTILGAPLMAGWLGLLVYALLRPDSDHLMAVLTLAGAVFGLIAAARQGCRIRRDAQPDPRAQIISPAHDDADERERRFALLRQIGSTIVLAVGSFALAFLSADRALKLLP